MNSSFQNLQKQLISNNSNSGNNVQAPSLAFDIQNLSDAADASGSQPVKPRDESNNDDRHSETHSGSNTPLSQHQETSVSSHGLPGLVVPKVEQPQQPPFLAMSLHHPHLHQQQMHHQQLQQQHQMDDQSDTGSERSITPVGAPAANRRPAHHAGHIPAHYAAMFQHLSEIRDNWTTGNLNPAE